MPDWKALVQARELPIPADELDRVTAPLERLEAAFRRLTADLAPDLEPFFTVRAAEDEE